MVVDLAVVPAARAAGVEAVALPRGHVLAAGAPDGHPSRRLARAAGGSRLWRRERVRGRLTCEFLWLLRRCARASLSAGSLLLAPSILLLLRMFTLCGLLGPLGLLTVADRPAPVAPDDR